MIDISNQIYTGLDTALKVADNSIKTSSVYCNIPSSFPFVSVEEIDNYINTQTSDCCNIENCVNVVYEINIYAKGETRKTKANKFYGVVDNYMLTLGFNRDSKTNIQDQNETIYRIVARYSAVVSKNKTIYRR